MVENPDLIRDLKRLVESAKADYQNYQALFKEVRDAIDPSIGRFDGDGSRGGALIHKALLDRTATKALETMVSGLMAGMTSPSRPWFKLGVHGGGEATSGAVKEWLHTTETRMYDVLRQSNAYRMLSTCYQNLGMFGTYCGLVVHDFEDVIRCHSFPIGRFYIAEGEQGKIEFMARSVTMTIRQTVDKFGYDAVSQSVRNAYDTGRDFDKITVQHVIYRRRDRNPRSKLSKDKPWASVYWEDAKDHLLEESGFSTNPLLVPRWKQVDGEAWSSSAPAFVALGDARQLQMLHREKSVAIAKANNPPMQVPASFSSARWKNVPGGVTVSNISDLQSGGARPLYEVRPDYQGINEVIYDTRNSVNRAFYTDLFLLTANSDRRQVTAREIAERHEEKMLVLGPVLESLDHALLQPLIQAAFHHMQEAKILPPAPPELQGAQIKVEYISALAQAQKIMSIAPIERVIGFAATLEQVKPGVMELVDADAALRAFTDLTGPPPSILHSADEIKKIREARAEREQAAQVMNAIPQMAQAAKLVSEANARGEQGLRAAGI